MSTVNKTIETQASVMEFLEGVENELRRSDALRLKQICDEITGIEAKLWGTSIVGYGSYHYKYESGREGDMPVIAFSPRKQGLTIYVMPGFDGYSEILDRLGKYTISKGSCLYIKKLTDVDEVVLGELIVQSLRDMRKLYTCKL